MQWHHGFHLYRLKDGEEFVIDKDKIKSEVRAKSLADKCKWNSVLCTPCFNTSASVTAVSTTQIFNEPGWYASFAKISDEAVAELWNLMNLPFKVETAELEHAFISNLETNMITASIHANPMTSSMAIQVPYQQVSELLSLSYFCINSLLVTRFNQCIYILTANISFLNTSSCI